MANIDGIGKASNVVSSEARLVNTATIDSIDITSSISIRINFSEPMIKNNFLLSPSEYYFINIVEAPALVYPPQDAEPMPLTPRIVEVPDDENPSYVDITTNEMTTNAVYELTTFGNLQTESGLYLDKNYRFEFQGDGESPTVKYAKAISLTQIEVKFSESMFVDDALIDPNLYRIDGLQVNSVEVKSQDTVILNTEEQTPGEVYDVTLGPRGIAELDENFEVENGAILTPSYIYRAADIVNDQIIPAHIGSDLTRLTNNFPTYVKDFLQDPGVLDKSFLPIGDDFEGDGGAINAESFVMEFACLRPASSPIYMFSCQDGSGNGWNFRFSTSGFTGFVLDIKNPATGRITKRVYTGSSTNTIRAPYHIVVAFDRTQIQQNFRIYANGEREQAINVNDYNGIDLTNGYNRLTYYGPFDCAWAGLWLTSSESVRYIDDQVLERYNKFIGNL